MDAHQQHSWEQDLRGLTLSYLTLLRQALRDDFPRACHTFGLRNRRFTQRIESMDQGQLLRLANSMTANFIQFDETLAMEVLVEGVLDNGSEEEIRMSVMAHAATDPARRADPVGVGA